MNTPTEIAELKLTKLNLKGRQEAITMEVRPAAQREAAAAQTPEELEFWTAVLDNLQTELAELHEQVVAITRQLPTQKIVVN